MSDAVRARALIVMAKEPVPGRVKTRLAREIGPAQAARLYAAFLRDTLAACAAVRSSELFIAFTPVGARAWFAELAPAAVLVEQPQGDLGARISAAFEAAFARGSERVILIGSDTPHLLPGDLERAFEELDEHDVVLGPALDGGYYLIGLGHAAPELVRDIRWSTESVLAETLERARELGLSCALGPRTFDVDDASDLDRLREHVRSGEDARCAHTVRVLREQLGSDA